MAERPAIKSQNLLRSILSEVLNGDKRAIRAFEALALDVQATLPDAIERLPSDVDAVLSASSFGRRGDPAQQSASGTIVTYGSATLDFGAAPGSNVTTVTVTGQPSIGASSSCQAWLQGDATATHNAYEHAVVPLVLRCTNIVPGTGFDITASTDWRLTGTFTVRWAWS